MTEILTPDQVIRELRELNSAIKNGIEIVHQCEIEAITKQIRADRLKNSAFMRIGGIVADRTALAELESTTAREEAEIARAAFNYAKNKLQELKDRRMGLQTQARLVEITYR